jgi:hypothetical protein
MEVIQLYHGLLQEVIQLKDKIMSHFAKVNNGKVEQVIVAEADFFKTFIDTTPGTWIQTSYNTRGNVHTLGGTPLRGNYAGIDYIYDATNDVFYAPQPFNSWILNKNTWTWEAPTPMPNDGKIYNWNENTKTWDLLA